MRKVYLWAPQGSRSCTDDPVPSSLSSGCTETARAVSCFIMYNLQKLYLWVTQVTQPWTKTGAKVACLLASPLCCLFGPDVGSGLSFSSRPLVEGLRSKSSSELEGCPES